MNKDILKEKLREIFIKVDPMGIYFPEDKNIDEYDKEIDLLIQWLDTSYTQQDLLEKIWQLFKIRFGNFEAGAKEKYEQLTNSVWKIIREDNSN